MSDRRRVKGDVAKTKAQIAAEAADPTREPEYWSGKISKCWSGSVASVIETGRLLIEAKAAVRHGGWKEVYERCGFSATMATRLIKIAECPHFVNPAHGPSLPPSWRTLYELTKLTAEQFDAALVEIISPAMERADIDDWRKRNTNDGSKPDTTKKLREAAADSNDDSKRTAPAKQRTMRPIHVIDLPGDGDEAGNRDATIPVHDLDTVREIQQLAPNDEYRAARKALDYVLSVELEDEAAE